MWKHKRETSLYFIMLITFIAVLLGFLLGNSFKSSINLNQSQNVNINTQQTKDKININTATLKELETLGSIGEVKAQKIIKGRPYKNTLQLINIIGEKTYSNIKNEIEVR